MRKSCWLYLVPGTVGGFVAELMVDRRMWWLMEVG